MGVRVRWLRGLFRVVQRGLSQFSSDENGTVPLSGTSRAGTGSFWDSVGLLAPGRAKGEKCACPLTTEVGTVPLVPRRSLLSPLRSGYDVVRRLGTVPNSGTQRSWVGRNWDCPLGAVRCGYDVVRILAAFVLLTAAFLKAYALSTEPVIEHSMLDNRWLLMGLVEFELLFGFWLLANLTPRLTWLMLVGCFSAFTGVSLYKAFSGYASCGCFGRTAVSPWYTSAGDCAFVISLLIWRPHLLPSPAGRGTEGEGGRGLSQFSSDENGTVPIIVQSVRVLLSRRTMAVLLAWLAIGLPAGYTMGAYTDATLSDAGTIIGTGKIVVLEPGRWIGKTFPLVNFVDIGERLKEGYWLVLLYHYDCPKCRATIHDLSRIAHELRAQRVALVAMPPYGGGINIATSVPDCALAMGRLNEGSGTHWFAETPLIVTLRDSEVTSIRTER